MDRQKLVIEFEREDDGCWIADVPVLPGVMVYGQTRAEARARDEHLARQVLADRINNGESFRSVDRAAG